MGGRSKRLTARRRAAGAAGAALDRAGRVKVLPDFSLPGHPELFVIGDLAAYETTPGRILPGVAQPYRALRMSPG